METRTIPTTPKKNSKTLYNFISPDGFSISVEDFTSEKKAREYLTKWLKRYESQGYYSSNGMRIPLDEIESHCILDIIN